MSTAEAPSAPSGRICEKQWIMHLKKVKKGGFPRGSNCYSLLIIVRHCWANLDINRTQMNVHLLTIYLFNENL